MSKKKDEMTMGDEAKQPARTPADGKVDLSRLGDDAFVLSVEHEGKTAAVTMGGFNAWRVFGMLALLLGIPLPKKLGEAIKF